MAPKRRMFTQVQPDVPDPDPDLRAPHEIPGESEPVPNMAEIVQEMRDMRQSIGVLMETINRPSPQQPVPIPVEPQVPVHSVPPPIGSSQTLTVSLPDFRSMHPPSFSGEEFTHDPSSFIKESHRICRAMGCTSERSVELVSFQLTGVADEWYTSFSDRRSSSDPPLTWLEFSHAFLSRFLPRSVTEARAREFEHLEQTDQMSVTEYDVLFTRLSHYAPHLVGTERLRVERFVNGLKDHLFRSIQILDTTTYADVLNAALRLEFRIKESQAKREATKKTKTEGSRKPQQQRMSGEAQFEPVQKSTTVSGSPSQRFRQGPESQAVSSTASSFRYPVCPSCDRRHSGVCRKATGLCYKCGQAGHFVRECPNSRDLATPPLPPRPLTGRGQTSDGRGQARVYAMTPQDMQVSDPALAGISLIDS